MRECDAPVVLIRCEFGAETGMGHLVRCLALAEELADRDVGVVFACRAGAPPESVDADRRFRWVKVDGHGSEQDTAEFVDLYAQVGAALAVLDLYGIDAGFQSGLERAGVRWLQFDGAATSHLRANLVVSMSAARSTADYAALVDASRSVVLAGPAFAILRRELTAIEPTKDVGTRVQRVVISMGGGDDRGAIRLVLRGLAASGWQGEIDVLLGQQHSAPASVRELATGFDSLTVRVHVASRDYAQVLSRADLAIIAGGMTSFETAYLGVPSLIIHIADNQVANAAAWQSLGVAENLGPVEQQTATGFARVFKAVASAPAVRQKMARLGRRLVDGRGVARIVDAMLAFRRLPEAAT